MPKDSMNPNKCTIEIIDHGTSFHSIPEAASSAYKNSKANDAKAPSDGSMSRRMRTEKA